jgi:hypothetical protein
MVAQKFNLKVRTVVDKLNKELPQVKIVTGNLYDLVLDVISNPTSYGK